MKIEVERDECTGCESCVAVCPVDAISMVDGLALIEQDLCIQCRACVDTCPVEAIKVKEE